MYCIHCGKPLAENANFCANCGASVHNSVSVSSSIASSGSGDHRLILVDRNECSRVDVENLLCDLLGYSAEDADRLVELSPVEIADNLSELQAKTLAQVFTEYGCQISIIDDEGEFVDLSDKADSSVFDLEGNLLEKTLAVIAALTVINRVTSYRRYKKPSLLERIFKPKYTILPVKIKRHRPHGRAPLPILPTPQVKAHQRALPRQPRRHSVHRNAMARPTMHGRRHGGKKDIHF